MNSTLLDHFDSVYATERKLSAATAESYRYLIRRFNRYCGEDVRLDTLDEAALSRWQAALKAKGYKPRTIHHHREVICAVWHDAYQREQTEAQPARRIRWMRSAPAGTLRHYYVTAYRATSQAPRHFDSAVALFTEFCGGDVLPMQVTGDRLYRFHIWLLERGHDAKYSQNAVGCIRSVVRSIDPQQLTGRTPLTPAADGSLREFFETTYLSEHDIKKSTIEQYRYSLTGLEKYAKCFVSPADLTDTLVNEWVQAMQADGLSPETVKRRLMSILTLWKAAWRWELTEVQPRRIRRVKVPRRMPDAWTPAEVGVLLLTTTRPEFDTLFRITRLHVGRFFDAFIRTTYDTAFRFGDVEGLHRQDIQPDGTIAIVQAKTGQQIVRAVRAETMEAIAETLADRERDALFPLPRGRKVFYHWWRRLLTSAGFPMSRRNGPQKLRRSASTHSERWQPGSARLLLGHLTPGQAEAAYIDPTQAYPLPLLPPAPVMPKLLPAPREKDGAA